MKMKKSICEKTAPQKQKESQKGKKNRCLVTVNVLGSTGPLRFVVNEEDDVTTVIDTALKMYTREGRLPVLGSDVNNVLLYPANAVSEALSPTKSIGTCEGRNFVLCKQHKQPQMTEIRSEMVNKRSGRWRAWLHKSFSFKMVSL
ncbi:hypothetical protein NMG60_11006091 [Bertholletia excelsa]